MRVKSALWIAAVLMLVAGFTAVSTAPAAVNAVNGGGWSALGGGIDGDRVFQIAVLPDGTLYAGGTFTTARTSAGAAVAQTARIAKWDPTTSDWSALGTTAPDAAVYALAYDGADHLWVGGAFTTINGANQERLARWNVSTSAWVSPTPIVQNPHSQTWQGVETILPLAPNNVLIGGGITTGTDVSRGLVRFDGTNLVTVSGGFGDGDLLRRIANKMTARPNGGAFVVGQFTQVSGSAIASRLVAEWDGTDWVTSSANAAFGGANSGPLDGIVVAVATTSAGLVVGGNFTKMQNNGTDVSDTNRLAMWNGTEWVSIGTVVGSVVEELRVIGNYLYVGGNFSSVGGVAANNIARAQIPAAGGAWRWEPITHGCLNGVNGVVRAIVDAGTGDGSIYVGGGFTLAGGLQYADRIAKYSPGAPACPAAGTGVVLPAPTNFRVEGLARDRVADRWGMRVHLAWEAASSYTFFTVSTAGRQGRSGFEETAPHTDFGCWSASTSCSIFFPFTSNTPSMEGRQYHQVRYTLQALSPIAAATTATVGPIGSSPAPVPAAPSAVRAQAGWKEVTVTWDRPEVDPLAGPITNYLAVAQPGNRVCIKRVDFPETADDRTCVFRGLTPGTKYRFEVQALSLMGWGEKSRRSNEVSPQNLAITSSSRSGPQIFLLGGTRIRVEGDAHGYPERTRITPHIRIGNGPWRALTGRRDPVVRVDGSGRFSFSINVGLRFNRQPVSVRFDIGDPRVCEAESLPAVSCGSTVERRFGAVR